MTRLELRAVIAGLLAAAVVRSLSDVSELPARRWDLPVPRWVDGTRANRRVMGADDGDEGIAEST